MCCENSIGIIMGAARVNEELIPILGSLPTLLIPINGKPAVYYTIHKFMEAGINRIVISVDHDKEKVMQWVTSLNIGSLVEIEFIHVDSSRRQGSVLLHMIEQILENEPDIHSLYVNTPDMIMMNTDELPMNTSFIASPSTEDLFSQSGVFHFTEPQIFREFNHTGHIEIQDILKFYSDHKPTMILQTEAVNQIDQLHGYYRVNRNHLNSRFFNRFKYNELLGTATKYSDNKSKFIDEIHWYLNIPSPLKALTPKVISYSVDNEDIFAELEYYGYPPLSELWLYSNLNENIWNAIVDKIIDIIFLFTNFKALVPYDSYKEIYLNKTMERIDSVCAGNMEIKQLFAFNELMINDRKVQGWPIIERFVRSYYQSLYQVNDNTIVHGDMCFSNILYDLKHHIIRLIDPRGNWGKPGIYGDIKYDLAKLRHSISGRYDFIVNDLFRVDVSSNKINLVYLLNSPTHEYVREYFDAKIEQSWSLNQIKFIEGLLFISMLPLHADHAKRQLAIFATGMSILNEVFVSEEKFLNTQI